MQNKINSRDMARQAGFSKWKEHLQSTSETKRRFWEKVTVIGPDDCWLWNGATNDKGYGSLTHKRRRWKSHRFAFFLTHGHFDFSMDVLHQCDTPLCCNPKHLQLGTHEENMRQMSERGRWGTKPRVFGEGHGNAKLTGSDVAIIRLRYAQGDTQKILAEQFSVTQANIYRIVHRVSWCHILP